MLQNLKVRLLLIGLVLLVSAGFMARNYYRPDVNGEPRKQPVTLGLDLQGGSHFQLELDTAGTQLTDAQRADAVERALTVVRLRVDELGVAEPIVQRLGEDKIIVELPGNDNESAAKEVLQRTAFLEFQIVRPVNELAAALPRMERAILAADPEAARGATPAAASDSQGAGPGGLFRTPGQAAADSAGADSAGAAAAATPRAPTAQPLQDRLGQGRSGELQVANEDFAQVARWLALPEVQRALPRGTELLWGVQAADSASTPGFRSLWLVDREPIMTGDNLEDAQGTVDEIGRPVVAFQLSRQAGREFERATTRHMNEQMAVALDGRVYTAPVIRGAISTRGQIELGGASIAEAAQLALVLRAGALPVPLKIAEERTVGPTLGADSIAKGQIAGALGVGLVILFMVGIYRFAGVLSIGALIVYVIMLLGMMAMVDAALTFPGVAGLILSIGMAVDANVLIFERMREELDRGRSVRAAINEGFANALPAIVDSNVTTLITCAILYYTGTGPIRGFAVTLAIGIIASMFTAIFCTRTFFLLWAQRRPAATTISI